MRVCVCVYFQWIALWSVISVHRGVPVLVNFSCFASSRLSRFYCTAVRTTNQVCMSWHKSSHIEHTLNASVPFLGQVWISRSRINKKSQTFFSMLSTNKYILLWTSKHCHSSLDVTYLTPVLKGNYCKVNIVSYSGKYDLSRVCNCSLAGELHYSS